MLLAHLHAVVPNSLLGKALHYLSAQWPKLTRYVENGAWPIDNNLAENAIRPFVVGRRNWLFADTVAGAHASANLYSLVETCKANGIDPYAYLVSLFRKLPTPKPPTTSKPFCPGVWQAVADRFRHYLIASAIVNGGVNRALTFERHSEIREPQ
jgi:transposase